MIYHTPLHRLHYSKSKFDKILHDISPHFDGCNSLKNNPHTQMPFVILLIELLD